MKVTVITIGGEVLGTIPKNLEIRGRNKTIQTTALLKVTMILRRVPET